MKKITLYTTLTILILSTFAAAQFPKIKIPKIKKPKIPKIDKNIGENVVSKNVGSSKGSNRLMVIDDGYTFFPGREPVKSERIEKYRGYIAKGWTLKSSRRILNANEANSTQPPAFKTLSD